MSQDALSPAQMFQARRLLRIKRVELAKLISARSESVCQYEVQGLVSSDLDLQTVRAALESAGVEFIAENGVRLRKVVK